jgi:hypothetical protein
VDRDAWHLLPLAQVDKSEKVLIHGVDSAFADQPDKVNGAVGLPRSLARLDERSVLEKAALGDCAIDAYEVLHYDASRAEIEMANLAVADLALR